MWQWTLFCGLIQPKPSQTNASKLHDYKSSQRFLSCNHINQSIYGSMVAPPTIFCLCKAKHGSTLSHPSSPQSTRRRYIMPVQFPLFPWATSFDLRCRYHSLYNINKRKERFCWNFPHAVRTHHVQKGLHICMHREGMRWSFWFGIRRLGDCVGRLFLFVSSQQLQNKVLMIEYLSNQMSSGVMANFVINYWRGYNHDGNNNFPFPLPSLWSLPKKRSAFRCWDRFKSGKWRKHKHVYAVESLLIVSNASPTQRKTQFWNSPHCGIDFWSSKAGLTASSRRRYHTFTLAWVRHRKKHGKSCTLAQYGNFEIHHTSILWLGVP